MGDNSSTLFIVYWYICNIIRTQTASAEEFSLKKGEEDKNPSDFT